MEYAVGVYDYDPEDYSTLTRMDRFINDQAKHRWTIKWIGTTHRETKLIILFERMRVD